MDGQYLDAPEISPADGVPSFDGNASHGPGTRDRELSVLFAELGAGLRRYAVAQGADVHVAEDVVSDAFVVLASLDSDQRGRIANIPGYLTTTVLNLVRRHHRQAARTVAVPSDDLDAPIPPSRDQLILDDSLRLVRAALATLGPRTQRVLQAIEVEGRSAREVAAELQLTPSNVTTIAYRARKELRVAYVRAFIDESPPGCGMDSDTLANVVAGTAGRRQERRLRSHAATCPECPRVQRRAAAELASGSLLVLASAIALGGAMRPESAAAHMPAARRGVGRGTLIGLSLVGVASAVGLTSLGGLPGEASRTPRTQTEPTEISDSSVSISADPDRLEVAMPAPGSESMWRTAVTNHSPEPVTVYLATAATVGELDESPMLELRRDGQEILSRLSLMASGSTISLGRIEAGSTVTVSGVVHRDITDTDETLSGELRIELSAAAWSDGDPTAGTRIEQGADGDLSLAATGGRPGALLAVGAAGMVLIGGALPLLRRRRQPRA